MTTTQDYRNVSVSGPLGKDDLLFYRLSGREQMSAPYEFDVELLSKKSRIPAGSVLGQSMTVEMEVTDTDTRYFNGVIAEFNQIGTLSEFFRYRAVLRPWLWLLTRKYDCRIFQDKTVPDIVKQVFKDNGFSDIDDALTGSDYPTWEYCVQYRESDFNFVSRLMEHEGIYYFFRHEKGKNILVLADSISAHKEQAGYAKIPYFPPENVLRRERDHIHEWFGRHEIQTGRFTLDDFDFKAPTSDLTAKSTRKPNHTHDAFEFYDYPGAYTSAGVGEFYARVRMDEAHTRYAQVHGKGNARKIIPGAAFALTDHYIQEENVRHVVVSAAYSIVSNDYITSGSAPQVEEFQCEFSAITDSQQFRPPRTTRKPLMSGPQTAIVVCSQGEEIWTDEYGRVKVQFHWDREGQNDEKSSCWVRVSHPMAGKNWGWISLPRKGQEVIVDFLEGDPDQPIITGRVYNADNMPPYALPANATQSGIKTRSSKEGTADNFNEIRFEDKNGEEEVYVHAEKDLNSLIENNETRKVGFDKKDKGDQTIDIYNDRTVTLEMGNDTLTIKTGNQTINISKGKSTTEAMQSIELIVGSNSIKIDQQGITIKGLMINIEGSTKADMTSPLTTVAGTGKMTVQGGIVMIN